MDFLKTILGDELFSQLQAKINAYNGDEANKEKQLKLANLAEGGYVSKDKHGALETEKNSIQTQLNEANTLIETLKKSNKADEALQAKVSEYESKIGELTAELNNAKINNAVQLAIRDAGGLDADYLAFKLKEKGDDGKIKDIANKMSELKTQLPNQFKGEQNLKVNPQPLPDPNNNTNGYTKKDILNKPYAERAEFARNNPEAYNEIMKN